MLYQFGLSAQRPDKFSHLALVEAVFSKGGGVVFWTHAYHKLIGETSHEVHELSKFPARYAISYVKFSQVVLPLFRDWKLVGHSTAGYTFASRRGIEIGLAGVRTKDDKMCPFDNTFLYQQHANRSLSSGRVITVLRSQVAGQKIKHFHHSTCIFNCGWQ